MRFCGPLRRSLPHACQAHDNTCSSTRLHVIRCCIAHRYSSTLHTQLHCTTALLHYCTTVLLYYCTTVLLYSTATDCTLHCTALHYTYLQIRKECLLVEKRNTGMKQWYLLAFSYKLVCRSSE
jgi:hypothetical protein